jgi:hypothetical protein
MLRISDDKRFIVRDDGSPFFYMGDTAWELFHRLDRDEAAYYLRTRSQQRFTVIQAVVLAEFDGLRVPNAYGHVPFHDLDPARPNEDYFRHVDWIVERAAGEGLVMGLLPTWGDKVTTAGAGLRVFNPDNARVYGQFLGARYRHHRVIWILGGDRRPLTGQHLLTYRAMAEGIRQVGADQPMTYHPSGNSSSAQFVHGEDWLDFNMLQSGHSRRDAANWDMISLDLARKPPKPVLDGEPNYEDHPVMGPNWQGVGDEWFDEYDCRKQAYRSLLAGACGHTYGCHDVWQMWDRRRPVVNRVRTPWPEALHLPGANQMRHVRSLFEARAWMKLIPDQSLVLSDIGGEGDHVRAARADDGSYAYVYLPRRREVKVDLTKLSGRINASWHDPRQGTYQPVGEVSGTATFHPPAQGAGEDWILVAEEASKNCAPPGGQSG